MPLTSDTDSGPRQISYSPKQLADATGLAEYTIQRLVREGQLAARKYGRKLLIDAESARLWVESLPSA
ncbi:MULTISPECIES: helix-turn-helix domain-containing protein [Nocardia]|uniref:helix-turn-helix domain-containing protein n=1 Tax=Nocardia TaxID=1817 RepID=UPI00237E4809|nr:MULTISPECIES: helix-turn-helix domain-containing protein [Nocardia]MDE1673740.1 helix-turn-helix domain-containing protein [Nocardia gipuzkoensis]